MLTLKTWGVLDLTGPTNLIASRPLTLHHAAHAAASAFGCCPHGHHRQSTHTSARLAGPVRGGDTDGAPAGSQWAVEPKGRGDRLAVQPPSRLDSALTNDEHWSWKHRTGYR